MREVLDGERREWETDMENFSFISKNARIALQIAKDESKLVRPET